MNHSLSCLPFREGVAHICRCSEVFFGSAQERPLGCFGTPMYVVLVVEPSSLGCKSSALTPCYVWPWLYWPTIFLGIISDLHRSCRGSATFSFPYTLLHCPHWHRHYCGVYVTPKEQMWCWHIAVGRMPHFIWICYLWPKAPIGSRNFSRCRVTVRCPLASWCVVISQILRVQQVFCEVSLTWFFLIDWDGNFVSFVL